MKHGDTIDSTRLTLLDILQCFNERVYCRRVLHLAETIRKLVLEEGRRIRECFAYPRHRLITLRVSEDEESSKARGQLLSENVVAIKPEHGPINSAEGKPLLDPIGQEVGVVADVALRCVWRKLK